MSDLPIARHLLHARPKAVTDTVVLDYEARLMRRRRLVCKGGLEFLADLAEVSNLDDHWGFALDDGRAVGVEAAPEDLVEVRGDLARLAWHIGNRHTPCEVVSDHLRIRRDHVIEAMLRQLGAQLQPVTGPFRPEGGAYGKGRTMGHDHGPQDHHS